MKEKKEVLYIFCAKIITAVLGIVFLSVETKLLSTSDVGDYSLVSGFISVLVSVMISWVGSSSLRYFDKYKDRLSVFNTTVFVLQMLCTAIVLMIVGISSVVMTNIPVKEYLLLTFALALMRSVYEVQEKMFRVNGKYAYYSMATIGQGVMNLVVMIVCARIFQWKAASIFMAAILSTAAFDILAIIMGKSYQEIKFSKYSKALTRTFLDYGVPMVGVWGISWVLNYADRYIIRIFNTASE
ncbi:MAG: oligosaccharide flippase family protein, partial [Blautia sp.]|nr:oligosaccharide flippase family protein [Blautia sp.]